MPYIKRLVMHGFKSFAKKTELQFTHGINVILGANGSGKSNVSDALCFVLGRLSIKSMRAAKASNLIFLGTKDAAPAKEAVVELILDNSDKIFSIDQDEVSIKRIVRRNGLSIYKINNETKTRQEVLTLLAQAGIDPNGFNIILQGEIQNFVRMHTEERRKIIEEVSGISVYESRKEKSLKELERTDEKLKEVSAILRERTAYLNNLEKERQQALRFKKLESDIKMYKASIINYGLEIKKKEAEKINLEISQKNTDIEKIKKQNIELQNSVSDCESKIHSINSTIEKETGFEQEMLNKQISDLRAEIAGLQVKIENYENKLKEVEKEKEEIQSTISKEEISVRELQKESPMAKKEKDLEKKKKEFEQLEDKRKKFYTVKSELKSLKEMIQDKASLLQNYNNESQILLKQIDFFSSELFDKKTSKEKLNELKSLLADRKEKLSELGKKESEFEKIVYLSESEISKLAKIVRDIAKLDICPLCKSKITPEHISSIGKEADSEIRKLNEKSDGAKKEIEQINKKRKEFGEDIEKISLEISRRELDIVKMSSINEKGAQIKNIQEKIDRIKDELSSLKKRESAIERSFEEYPNIEQKYETARIELQEISLRSEENLSSEVSFKQREVERLKVVLKQLSRDNQDLGEDLQALKKDMEEKESDLEEKNNQEEALTKRFERLISERDSLQVKTREYEKEVMHRQNSIHNIELQTNEQKIHKARVDAEKENFEIEMLGFSDVKIIKANKDDLIVRLNKTQETISKIGTVNFRSLEVYDSIKQEYDAISNKVEIIQKEKGGILRIVHEIDIKKKKAFTKTLDALNELFSRNFSQLSTKGHVFLEVEDKKEPFSGGVNIIVKTGHGKYFDVKSLSGGEQTLVALSLIFAIQEYNPYSFYILDEIDAALDKRNSERLASLLLQYMQKGQYIVITHNDEVITKATSLYGVSMHDGISKTVSLRV
ncbi:MAG: chromosome segregation protein SMC [Nanoarchaeota archaeon]|nr:chromosome segregation protein SMC [Nanoarchaeota archaeon]